MPAYRTLLYLYPASFRAEYGDEMFAIFAKRRHAARGLGAVAALWIETLGDVLLNAARTHWDLLRQDLRYTTRTLARAPGFAFTVILVSALGIGATTAAFSLADHVLVRPLPYTESHRLVKLWQDQSFRGYPRMELSPPNYVDWKRLSTSFDGMAAYTLRSGNLVGEGEPARLDGAIVTPDVFAVLGAQATIGRVFTSADGREDATAAIVLSHGLWESKFGADPEALGRRVSLNDVPQVIVGVMPRSFHFPTRDVQFWTPLRLTGSEYQDRADVFLQVVARLKSGVSVEQARSELGVIAAQLARAYPNENAQTGATIVRLRDEVPWQSRMMLTALAGASLCVLLIACTNLANLLLTRALSRERELAVRAAVGAGRPRLVRQLLTESTLLAVLGGALGVIVALLATPLAVRLVPNGLPISETPGMDARILAFALVLTLATGLGFGLVPAIRAGRSADASRLREGARSGNSRRTERLRAALVIAEVTISLALLISSGLLIRALWRVQNIDPGFQARGVLALRTALPMPKYEQVAQREAFYGRVLADVRALPGVFESAYISFLPMVWRGGIWPVTLENEQPNPAESRMASLRFVTPGFFKVLDIPVREGRDVTEADTQTSLFVAVVSESFVEQAWPGQNAIGRKFQVAFRERTIVGVVGDIKVRGLERQSEPQVYVPSSQVPDGGIIFYTPKELVIRSSATAGMLAPAVRQIIARADPELPVSDVQTLEDILTAETAPRRVQVRVLGAFAVVAFLLASIGIHGLLAFSVSSRAREIGVRMALGASSRNVLGMVLRQVLMLAMTGVALGVALALAAGRAMQALLAGISPTDATTFGAAVTACLLMALAGSLAPAWRAVRVNPVTAIRTE